MAKFKISEDEFERYKEGSNKNPGMTTFKISKEEFEKYKAPPIRKAKDTQIHTVNKAADTDIPKASTKQQTGGLSAYEAAVKTAYANESGNYNPQTGVNEGWGEVTPGSKPISSAAGLIYKKIVNPLAEKAYGLYEKLDDYAVNENDLNRIKAAADAQGEGQAVNDESLRLNRILNERKNLLSGMTDEQKNIYDSLPEWQRKDYLDSIAAELNQKAGLKEAEYISGEGRGTASPAGYAFAAGVNNFGSGLKGAVNLLRGKEGETAAKAPIEYTYGAIAPSLKGGEKVLSDIAYTTGNMAPSMAVGLLSGGLGTAAMGISSAGNSYDEAIREGYTPEKAAAYGISSGIKEAALQRVAGALPGVSNAQSVLTKALGKYGHKAAEAVIKNDALRTSLEKIAGSALSEGSEEYVQELLDPILKNIFLGEDNEVKAFTPEALYAGALGAISGGMFEVPGAIKTGVEVRGTNVENGTEGSTETAENVVTNNNETEIVKRDMSNADEQNNYRSQIKKMMLGKMSPAEIIRVGTTPEILQHYGAKNHNITLKQSTVRKIVYPAGYMGGNHNLGFYFLDSIPNQLNNPVAILKSKTQADSLVIITEFLDAQNNPVQIALHLDKQGNLGIANEIASAYGKRGFKNYIELNRKEGNVLYENQEKGLDELPGIGLQLPKLEAKSSDPINSIDLKSSTVNREYMPEAENDTINLGKNIINETEAESRLNTDTAEAEVKETEEKRIMRRKALRAVNPNSPDAQNIYRGIMRNYGYGDMISKMDAIAKRLGSEVQFYADNTNSEGYNENNVIHLNVNNLRSSADGVWKVFKHELTHSLEGTNAYGELLRSKAGAELFNEFLKKGGYTVTDAEGNTTTSVEVLKNEIRKLYAKNNVELSAEQLNHECIAKFIEQSDILTSEESIQRLAEGSPNFALRIYNWIKDTIAKFGASPETKMLMEAERLYAKALRQAAKGEYQYNRGGERQNLFIKGTEDQYRLMDVMEQKGMSREEIWKATGLIRDTKGNVITEINDKNAKFYPNGDLRFRKDHPEYARYEDLYSKLLYRDLTESELAEFKELGEIWGRERARLKERFERGNAKLGDVFEHDKLYAVMPELEDVPIRYVENLGARGERSSKGISLSAELDASLREAVVLHEVQHEIQAAEGRPGGASPEYWQQRINNGETFGKYDRQIKKAEQERQIAWEQMPDEAKEKVREINREMIKARKTGDFDKVSALEEAMFNSEYADLYGDYASAQWELEMYISDNKPLTANQLYMDTSGEIEARQTSSRRNSTDEERRNKMPDFRWDEARFAYGSSVGYHATNAEEKSIKKQILDNLDAINELGPVAVIYSEGRNGLNTSGQYKAVLELLKSTGYKVDRKDFGEIIFEENQIKRSLDYVNTDAEFAAYEAIPKVLKRGIQIDSHEKHKGREYDTYTFAAPIKLNEKLAVMAVVVKKTKGNRYKVHRVVSPDGGSFEFYKTKNTEPTTVRGVTETGSLAKHISSVSNNSIYNGDKNINKKFSFKEEDTLTGKETSYLHRATNNLLNDFLEITGADGFTDKNSLKADINSFAQESAANGKTDRAEGEKIFDLLYNGAENNRKAYADAKNEFMASLNRFEQGINDVIRYTRSKEAAADQRAGVKAERADKANTILTDKAYAKQFYKDFKQAKRAYDKLADKEMLTAEDTSIMRQLSNGTVTMDEVEKRANEFNVDAIKRVYDAFKAKTEFEKVQGQLRKSAVGRNRELAKERIANSDSWQDKKAGALYKREIMERNIEDITKGANGKNRRNDDAVNINKTYFKPIHENEAKSNRLKNELVERVKSLKLGTKGMYTVMIENDITGMPMQEKVSESGLVQLYGEGIIDDATLDSLNVDKEKIHNAVKEFRDIYNQLLDMANETLIRNGYEPVEYRKNYFPHFTENKADSVLGEIAGYFGIDINADELPTDIAGITHTFRPGKRWVGNFLERKTNVTDYDALKGFDRYLNGAADVIFHTDDIQRLRALETELRYKYSNEGTRERLREIEDNPALTTEQKQSLIDDIMEKNKMSHLPNLVTELRNYTDNLAGKKSISDRDWEHTLGRDFYSFMKKMENRVSANMVALNPASWLTNFIPITQVSGIVDSRNLTRAIWDATKSYAKSDGFSDRSDFLVNRRGSDMTYKTTVDKVQDRLTKPFEIIDNFTADVVTRALYYDQMAKVQNEAEALEYANDMAARIMADRSKGAQPTIFNKQSPVAKLFTMFQVEVNNQYSYMFKDVPAEIRKDGLGKLAAAFFKMFLGAFLYNEVYEKIVGRRAAFDPVDIAASAIRDFTNPDVKKSQAIANMALNVVDELPFVGGLLGGGRVPMSSALPDIGNLNESVTGLLAGEMNNKKAMQQLGKELIKPAAYLIPPVGGGQTKKTIEGLWTMAKGEDYTYDSDGNKRLKYAIDKSDPVKTAGKYVQAAIFGKSALPEAQEYYGNSYATLSAKQTQNYYKAVEAGITYKQYMTALGATKGLESDKDKDGNTIALSLARKKKAAIDKAVEDYGLTKTQKEILYEANGVSESVW